MSVSYGLNPTEVATANAIQANNNTLDNYAAAAADHQYDTSAGLFQLTLLTNKIEVNNEVLTVAPTKKDDITKSMLKDIKGQ